VTETPRLHTNSQTVSLSFESSLIQSCMRLDAPDDLVLDYTRTMMGCLLFNAAPQSILMIGLGGGSMVKYLHKHVPEADITVVEINAGVIDMRHEFLVPPDSDRLHTVCADGARFLVRPPQAYDLILVDGFTGQGMPDDLCSRSFYQHCRAALTPHGLLVANVQADTVLSKTIHQRVSKAFAAALVSVASDEGGNDIIVATDREVLTQTRDDFDARWAALAPVHQQTLAVCSLRYQRALRFW
jgi:spermidine synthase